MSWEKTAPALGLHAGRLQAGMKEFPTSWREARNGIGLWFQ